MKLVRNVDRETQPPQLAEPSSSPAIRETLAIVESPQSDPFLVEIPGREFQSRLPNVSVPGSMVQLKTGQNILESNKSSL